MCEFSPVICDLLTAIAVCAAIGVCAGLALYVWVRWSER